MFSKRTDWKLVPNALTLAQEEMKAGGREVLDLTVSNPTRVGLNYDVDEILTALSQPQVLDYDPQPKGMLSARQAVAAYYRDQHDAFGIDPENIVLTASTSEGYSYVFRLLCNPGDKILVPNPSYPLLEFLADLQDVTLVPYPLVYDHGWQIDFASLYKQVDHHTRAILIVHPNNPTGSYVRQEEISPLYAFCRDYNLALVVDEVFLDYAHDGAPRPSFAANPGVLTFTLSGLSKISALPQMKLAWIVTSGPEDRVPAAIARLEVIADTFLSMSAPLQLALPVLLEQRKHIQPVLRDRLRANLEELDRQLADRPSCSRLEVEGGWYVVLRIPVTESDEELAIRILRSVSVLVHPGHFYDFHADGHLVLSLITPSEHFRQGVHRALEVIEVR
ncbi:MAG TPA: pyridoxal phosphate-dependent aminotransferase [Terriglobales bacterium]|nr:pyridoxal phosphate-dependent aminotransferase [Terriglobales bacterium]